MVHTLDVIFVAAAMRWRLTKKPLEGGGGVAVPTEALDCRLVARFDGDVLSRHHVAAAVLDARPLRRN